MVIIRHQACHADDGHSKLGSYNSYIKHTLYFLNRLKIGGNSTYPVVQRTVRCAGIKDTAHNMGVILAEFCTEHIGIMTQPVAHSQEYSHILSAKIGMTKRMAHPLPMGRQFTILLTL
jgi:hypothetical protein